jgi:hypothetical protein
MSILGYGTKAIKNRNMANKILFIGVGGAGCTMADKAMKDNPELFESVAIDCGTNRNLSCYQLNMMNRHPYDENPGFTTIKENVDTLVNENINEIMHIFDCYNNDRLDDIDIICHTIEK